MTHPILLLAAAPVSALPPDAATAAAAAAPAASINYIQLVLHASWPVLIVMVLLLIASVMSWFVIFRKMGVGTRAAVARRFDARASSTASRTAMSASRDSSSCAEAAASIRRLG